MILREMLRHWDSIEQGEVSSACISRRQPGKSFTNKGWRITPKVTPRQTGSICADDTWLLPNVGALRSGRAGSQGFCATSETGETGET
jgi:hypothetical protein